RFLRDGRAAGLAGLFALGTRFLFILIRWCIYHEAILAFWAIDFLANQGGTLDGDTSFAAWALDFEGARSGSHSTLSAGFFGGRDGITVQMVHDSGLSGENAKGFRSGTAAAG